MVSAGDMPPQCRLQPSDMLFPSVTQLAVLNVMVHGRLIHIVPSAAA